MLNIRPLRHWLRRIVICGAALSGALGAMPAAAQGDLLVAPTRIVIANGGSAEVILSNIGNQSATYRISLELRRMDEDGDINDVAEADANPTEQAGLAMIRYAPRRITLLPGQPQSVRISVRPPEGLPDGEYRVHMSFRAIPPAAPAEEVADPNATGVSIRLVPVYGITIPVIVRKGRLEASATLANPRLMTTPQGSYLEIDMTRTGQRSVYGELNGKDAKGNLIFSLKGIAVYPEVGHRVARIPLNPEQAARIKGPIRIEYRELPENGGALIAEITTTVK